MDDNFILLFFIFLFFYVKMLYEDKTTEGFTYKSEGFMGGLELFAIFLGLAGLVFGIYQFARYQGWLR